MHLYYCYLTYFDSNYLKICVYIKLLKNQVCGDPEKPLFMKV